MSVGDNTIATWCAELNQFESQIEALQGAKRDFYAKVREEHGKPLAASLKLAVKLSRTDDEKLRAADEIDAEAWRIVGIIAKSRAPRATRARESIEQFDRETGEFLEAGNPVSDQSTAVRTDAPNKNAPGHGAVNAGEAGTQAPPVDTQHPAVATDQNADANTGAPADEAEPPQGEASSVPANPDRPRRTLAEMRGVFAGEPRKRIQLVDDEPTEGGENVDPQVLGEVETHASPAINPDCAHPDTCQFATKSYCCSQCSSARSARLQAQRKVRA